MAKLSPRTNKKAEARQIASELLKENEYVYNPRENTYQLVNKKTGEIYTGPLGGLDADKGLLQKDRRLRRLIGEQLSHQRHLVSREPVKASVKDGAEQKSKTEDGTDKTSTGTTADSDIKNEDKKINKSGNEDIATLDDIIDFKILEDESFSDLKLPISERIEKLTKGKSQKEKEELIKMVESRIGGPVAQASSTSVSRQLPIIDESKIKFPDYIPILEDEPMRKSGLSAHNYPINEWTPKEEFDSSMLPKAGLMGTNVEYPQRKAGIMGTNVEYRKSGGRLKERKCGGTMKREKGGTMKPKYQGGGGADYFGSELDQNDPVVFDIDPVTGKKIKPLNKVEPIDILETNFKTEPKLAEVKPSVYEKPSIWDKTKGLVSRYIGQGSGGTQDADTRSLLEKSMDYANPVLTGADYLVQRNALKDIGKQKSVRTYNTPVQLNVRAASDIPYEVLVARENAINRMRSGYKGSDPVMELVSKQMTGDKKQQAREKLGAERAEYIAKERARVDEMENKNRILMGETQQKNLDLKRQYDEADRLHDINIDDRQASLTGQLIGTTAKGLENRLNTRDMAAMKAHELELKQIGSDIAYYSSIVRDADGSTPEGRNEIRKAQEELERLQNKQKLILGEVGGKYTQLGEDVMLGMKKDGGKLIARK